VAAHGANKDIVTTSVGGWNYRRIKLVELDFSMFDHDRRKRLRRNAVADEAVVRAQLCAVTLDESGRLKSSDFAYHN
jgi:hypothetical protein